MVVDYPAIGADCSVTDDAIVLTTVGLDIFLYCSS